MTAFVSVLRRGALTAALLCSFTPALRAQQADEAKASWWGAPVEAALGRAGANAAELRDALARVPVAQRPGLAFLLEHMPKQDLERLGAAFLLDNVAGAYEVRSSTPWGRSLPEAMFLNEVLPYAHVSESRDPWRRDFMKRFLPLVADCQTAAEAAQRLNEKAFAMLGVKYSTRRKRADQSPKESIEQGLASCTGLSILLADACRAVGVPARLVGIPKWTHKAGNHTWVEVWDGRWRFTGAAEPSGKGLDHAWFTHDASKAVEGSANNGIFAVSFKRTPRRFPMAWAPGWGELSGIEVTSRYLRRGAPADPAGTLRVLVRVWDGLERVAAGVRVTGMEGGAALEGRSKDEGYDLNDILSFVVPEGAQLSIVAEHGARRVERALRCADPEQELVELRFAPARQELPGAAPKEPAKQGAWVGLDAKLAAYFAATEEQRAKLRFSAAEDALAASAGAELRRRAYAAYRRSPQRAPAKADFEANKVQAGGLTSPYVWKRVGERPEGGWPLFIAMHGGGGAPKKVNDSQWSIMQRYYRDQKGGSGYLYLALRAPNDNWNGFYFDGMYPLVARLIDSFVAFADVDPDKVFIMGYSHGGYGAFAIGPKMPDRFAAIHSSAAAPTDGQSSARTLRNTRFTYMIGERDKAYGRLKRCRAFDKTIKALRGDRDDIYPVEMEYKAGHGHGGLPDRDKIRTMITHRRVAWPRDLSWELTDGVITDFYWLQVSAPARGQRVEARCHENVVSLELQGRRAVTLRLDERLVELSKPVVIEVSGRRFERRLKPQIATLCESLIRRGDPRLAASCELRIELEEGGD